MSPGPASTLKNWSDSNRLQEAANSMTLELANLQIKELKYLIIDKLQQAQDQGIKTKVEINKPIATLPVNIVSIIRCVGIFLDNAIEACQSQADGQISVLLTKYSGNNYSLIVQNIKAGRRLLQKGLSGWNVSGRPYSLYCRSWKNLF